MALFLKARDCKVAIVLYHDKNIITQHDSSSQSLTLPIVNVLKRHLVEVLTSDEDKLDPILSAFENAALEYVANKNLQVRSIRHVKDQGTGYLFKCDVLPTHIETFAIEIIHGDINDVSIVAINIDKIFCKIGTANNNDMNVYYNGLKIDTMSALVLIEYWNLRFIL